MQRNNPENAGALPLSTTESALSRRDFLALSTAGAASLLLYGCGGNGSANGGGGLTMPDAQRNAALQAVGDHFDTLPHQSMDSDNAAILAFLQSRPEFVSARLTDTGTVAARFSDGPGFVFINNLDDVRDNGRGVRAARAHRAASQLPEGGKAMLLNGMGFLPFGPGNALNQYINQLRASAHLDRLGEMFQLRGYQVTKDFASIANLRKVQGVDVFYFIGHGGRGIDDKGQEIYVINTADSIILTPKTDEITDDLIAGYIGFALYVELNKQRVRASKACYYITPDFVRNYMRFNKFSLVFINGCAGAPAPAGIPTGIPDPKFHQAFFDAQASAYAGWDDKVNAGDVRDSAEFFFDRLLGAAKSDVPGVKKDPPVRPFGYDIVWNEMRNAPRPGQNFLMSQSLDSDPVQPNEPPRRLANLNVLPNPKDPDTFGLLAPSIQNLAVSDANSELTVFGRFGTVAGTVTMGGQALTVKEWNSAQITCTLPDNGGGDVVVNVNGRVSAPRRLTEWVLPLHYRGTGTGEDGHVETADFLLRLRADTQGYRPSSSASPTTTNLGFVPFSASPGSTCNYNLSGKFSGKFGDDLVHELAWAGGENLPPKVGSGAGPTGGFFFYNGHFDFNAKKLILTFGATAAEKVTETIPSEPNVPPVKSDWSMSSAFFGMQQLTLPLDNLFAISGGPFTGSWPGNSISALPNMSLTLNSERTPPVQGTEPVPNSAR